MSLSLELQGGFYVTSSVLQEAALGQQGSSYVPCSGWPQLKPSLSPHPARCHHRSCGPAHPGRHSPQTASAVAVQLDFWRRLMRAQERQVLQPWWPQLSLNFLGGQGTHCASPPPPSPQSCKT